VKGVLWRNISRGCRQSDTQAGFSTVQDSEKGEKWIRPSFPPKISFQEDTMSFNQIISRLSDIYPKPDRQRYRSRFERLRIEHPVPLVCKHIEKQLPWLHCVVDSEKCFLCFATEDAERGVDVSASII
jgi:hypothetical protein